MTRPLGGYIGFNRTPTLSAASGIWTLEEAQRYNRAGAWPRREYLADIVTGTIHGLYSVRLAREAYSGNLLKIKRSNDSAELDVPADYSGVSAWLGANSATVVKWYDQSGNAAHLDYAGSEPTFTLAGEAGSNYHPFITISASARFSGTIADLDGNSNALVSAVVSPVGSQSSGTNKIDRAIAYIAESGGWGAVSLSVLDSEIAWRFGTGSGGNTPSRSRSPSSNSWCVGTVSKFGATEKAYVNAVQLGATYTASASSLSNNGTTLAVGGGETAGGADAKICELLVCVNPGTGNDVKVAEHQAAFLGL